MEYLTVKSEASAEFIERRSRFIGHIKPVTTEEEAAAFIEEKRSKYWDATHNVYAYCLRGGGLSRCSDDGEPSGTAGVPVLSTLTKPGITDAVVVVTRYFGGVLLGAGGLVRAYSHAASIAAAAGGLIIMRQCADCRLECDYGAYGRVAALIPEADGVIDDAQFTDRVTLLFHMTDEALAVFSKRLADATCGGCTAERIGERFYAFPKDVEQ